MTKKLHNPKAYAPAVYIPCWLIQVPIQNLSHGAKIFYGRLAQWSNEKGDVYRSIPQLSKEIGTSKSSIDRLIKELKDVGLIGTFHPQLGGVSHFQFYDHDWMYEPIVEQLSYKNDPTSDLTLPHVKSDVTPTSDLTSINIKKIKRNKINNISTFDKVPSENEISSESELNDNQALENLKAKEGLEGVDLPTKSDYRNKQTEKESISLKIKQYDIKDILSINIFQIPEEIIQDWITNRKKKRAAITKTAWNKINKELAKCKEHGLDPVEVFEKVVAQTWVSFDAEWFYKEKKGAISSQWDVDSVMRA